MGNIPQWCFCSLKLGDYFPFLSFKQTFSLYFVLFNSPSNINKSQAHNSQREDNVFYTKEPQIPFLPPDHCRRESHAHSREGLVSGFSTSSSTSPPGWSWCPTMKEQMYELAKKGLTPSQTGMLHRGFVFPNSVYHLVEKVVHKHLETHKGYRF